MRRHVLYLAAAAAVGSLVCSASSNVAFGAISLIDQSRSLSASATGTYGPSDSKSDSSLASGSYNNTLNASKTDTAFFSIGQDTYIYKINSTATQTSTLSALSMSGSGSATAGASIRPLNTAGADGEAIGDSTYNVDFSVDVPTPFTIIGEITGHADYHPGPLEAPTAHLTLTSSTQGSLYKASDTVNTLATLTSSSFDDPISFQTTLQPGQTYTLNVQAHVDSLRAGGDGVTVYAPATATFSFTATVPEPATAALISLLALPLLIRRQRWQRAECRKTKLFLLHEHLARAGGPCHD
jgi:hypothetical protein